MNRIVRRTTGRPAERRRTTADRSTRLAALALTAGVAITLTGCGQDESAATGSTPPSPAVSAAPAGHTASATPTAAPTRAATPSPTPSSPPSSTTLQPGTYQVRVLSEGADTGGKHLVLDLGRIVVGEPTEPGVDSTRPTTFDTRGTVERLRVDLAAAHELTFNHPRADDTSYGRGEWPELVTEIDGRSTELLATITIDRSGELSALTEAYQA